MLSTTKQDEKQSTIASLTAPDAEGTKGYWSDAWGRLARNKVALIGLIVILLNVILAVFAPWLSVEGYNDQKTDEANAAPQWIVNLFPIMSPRDENFPIEGELLVSTGQRVTAGELLVSFNDLNANAPADGRIFITDRRIFFVPSTLEIPEFNIAGQNLIARNEQAVKPGDILFGETASPIDGRVFIGGDTLWIVPTNSWLADLGQALVTTGQSVNAGDILMINTIFTDASGGEVSSRRFERFTLPSGASLHVEHAALVAEGDLLFDDVTAPKAGIVYLNNYELWIAGETQTDLVMTSTTVAAPVAGVALVNRGAVDLSFVPVERIAIPEGAEVLVANAADVTPETILFGETLSPIAGKAYLGTGEIIIRPYESWLVGNGIVMATMAQEVTAGAAIINFSPLNVYANMDGTVFINGENLILSPLEIPRYPMPADGVLSVNEFQTVTEGTVLFGTTVVTLPDGFEIPLNSSGVEIAPTFTVYKTDTEVLLLPQNTGYVPLRNYYPLGADDLGRDLWSRIAYGARVSLLVALIGPLVSFIVGLPYGLISGYFGGSIDNWLMRFVDLMYAFPTLLLIILLMAFFRSSTAATQPGTFTYVMGELDRSTGGMFFIFLGTGLTSWMGLARLARGLVLSVREQEYVVAARALGQTTPQIMIKHILPNILGPIVISETLSIPTYIRYEAFLSFIGLGVNPPTPSWGNMIADGARVLRSYPHEALFPAVALFFIMFAFNFLGDGLRDALDPRLRGVD